MKPTIRLAETRTPAGRRLVLTQHDQDFNLLDEGLPLMTSREHESELELARLGCARIATRKAPRVLIGGLGLGYTLRQTLDMLPSSACVVVAELLPDVVEWNRTYLAGLTGHPLRDKRVTVKVCDVADVVRNVKHSFDAILIDIDNGPEAITDYQNHQLYSSEGISLLMRAMHAHGCLAIWSAGIDPRFERRMRSKGMHVRAFQVPAHKGGKARSKCIWVASMDPASVPPKRGVPPPRPPPPQHPR
jgi:spermidine synthase